MGWATAAPKVNFQQLRRWAAMMKDGHAQAFTLGTTIPASSVMDLARSRHEAGASRATRSSGMNKINPGYT